MIVSFPYNSLHYIKFRKALLHLILLAAGRYGSNYNEYARSLDAQINQWRWVGLTTSKFSSAWGVVDFALGRGVRSYKHWPGYGMICLPLYNSVEFHNYNPLNDRVNQLACVVYIYNGKGALESLVYSAATSCVAVVVPQGLRWSMQFHWSVPCPFCLPRLALTSRQNERIASGYDFGGQLFPYLIGLSRTPRWPQQWLWAYTACKTL